jgi:oligopeptide transport system permease protein
MASLRSIAFRFSPLVAVLFVGWLWVPLTSAVALPEAFSEPLGRDEFGRNAIVIAARAIVVSLLEGGLLTVWVLVFIGIFVSFSLSKQQLPKQVIALASQILEGTPALLWVMVVAVAIPEPLWATCAIALTLATGPTLYRVLSAELARLRSEPFVVSSRMLGISWGGIALRHLIPHSWLVLRPILFQICGLAMALSGVLGFIGLGRRIDVDLGTLLWRAKEQVLDQPLLLPTAIAAMLISFGVLYRLNGRSLVRWLPALR